MVNFAPGRITANIDQIGGTTTTLGQKVMASSAPVTIASDQTNVPVSQATAASLNATVVQATAANLLSQVSQPTASNLNAQVVGSVADASVDSGNPLKTGLVGRLTNRTSVTDGQRVNQIGDKQGRAVVVLNHVRDLVTYASATFTTTTEATVLASGGAGVFHDVTSIIITNTSATGARVDIRDATAGTVRLSVWVPPTTTYVFPLDTPIPQTTAANNWTAQLSAAVTDVRVWIQAVKNV